jgi:hypothetical protein
MAVILRWCFSQQGALTARQGKMVLWEDERDLQGLVVNAIFSNGSCLVF